MLAFVHAHVDARQRLLDGSFHRLRHCCGVPGERQHGPVVVPI